MVSLKYYLHESSSALSPLRSPSSTLISGKPLHSSSQTSFPIIAVAIIGILATGFLLVSYYIFVIKCCLNWHRIDLLRRFSFSRRRPRVEDPSMAYSPAAEKRGLDEALIRAIPIFYYKKGSGKDEDGERSIPECAVCLNEFQEDEKLRSIPICGHMFHIDCIDVWLQNNANCPLCRNSISISSPARFPVDHITAPSSSPQIQTPHSENFMHGDENYVFIEIREQTPTNQTLIRVQERLNSGDNQLSAQQPITSPPRKLRPEMLQKKAKKFSHVSSMGDECIDIRHDKDEQFGVQQPIRRSFSMDSAADRQLYLAVQEIVQQHKQLAHDVSAREGCSNIMKRSFFSFGHGRGSRSAVLPVHMELRALTQDQSFV